MTHFLDVSYSSLPASSTLKNSYIIESEEPKVEYITTPTRVVDTVLVERTETDESNQLRRLHSKVDEALHRVRSHSPVTKYSYNIKTVDPEVKYSAYSSNLPVSRSIYASTIAPLTVSTTPKTSVYQSVVVPKSTEYHVILHESALKKSTVEVPKSTSSLYTPTFPLRSTIEVPKSHGVVIPKSFSTTSLYKSTVPVTSTITIPKRQEVVVPRAYSTTSLYTSTVVPRVTATSYKYEPVVQSRIIEVPRREVYREPILSNSYYSTYRPSTVSSISTYAPRYRDVVYTPTYTYSAKLVDVSQTSHYVPTTGRYVSTREVSPRPTVIETVKKSVVDKEIETEAIESPTKSKVCCSHHVTEESLETKKRRSKSWDTRHTCCCSEN